MKTIHAPIEYLFASFPREAATPFRCGMLRDMGELGSFINRHNGKTNVYTSVHSFTKLRAPGKPDFQSARIEFVPMDFDGVREGVADAFRLHNWLLDHGLEHAATFSGGGCHVFVRASPETAQFPAAALNGAQTWLEKVALAGAAPSVDKDSFFGDPARVIRIPNTFNRNKGRYDVPLTARMFEELAAAVELDAQAAAQAVAVRPIEIDALDFVQRGERLDISKWDNAAALPARGRWSELDMGEFKSSEVDTGVPVVIDNPLIQEMVGPLMDNETRGRVIIYLYEAGYSLGEVLRFMRQTLDPGKFKHMLYDERQPQRIWERFVR